MERFGELPVVRTLTDERKTGSSECDIRTGVATGEQSAAIAQVNTVVGEMDRITQQNAALVEESTAASSNLSNAAVNLLQMVQRFKIERHQPEIRRGPRLVA